MLIQNLTQKIAKFKGKRVGVIDNKTQQTVLKVSARERVNFVFNYIKKFN